MEYNKEYYLKNSQSDDRLALKFFSKLLKKYCANGALLDYGCGTGYFLKKFPPTYFQKSGIELSEYAKKRAQENNPECTMYNELNEVADNSLDCVASLHVMEHLEKPEDTIQLFFTKLRLGGILFITMPNASSLGKSLKKEGWFAYRDDTHISLLEVAQWKAIVHESGFEILKVGTDGLWDVPYLRYVPVFMQKLLFYPTAAVQIISNSLFIPLRYGENLIIIAQKK